MDRRNRPVMFAVGVALVSAAALAIVEWPYLRAWYRPPRADLPAPEAVARVEASVWASGSQFLESDLPRFVVPDDIGPRLLKRFTPNTYLPRPPVKADAPLGEVVVTGTDGRETRVLFYETGPDDLVFTVDGKHFFQSEPRDDLGYPLGGALLLAGTLRHAAATSDESDDGHPVVQPPPPTDPLTADPPQYWPPAGSVTPR